MKINLTTLKELAEILKASYKGNANLQVSGINEVHVVEEGDIVFVDHPKYYDKVLNSKASVILIDKEVAFESNKGIIIIKEPFKAFNQLIKYFTGVANSITLAKNDTIIGKNSIIHPSVYIGRNVTIGDNCIVYPNVCLMDNTVLRNNVVIQSNTTIGGDAFYYKTSPEKLEKMISCGSVILENYVEIGANTCIDRGVTGTTLIGEQTKIDSLVHIGHDTVVGKRCVFAAHVGVAGCCRIGSNVTLWGKVGLASDIEIGDNVVVLAYSGVSKSLASDKTYFGIPAVEAKQKYKEMVLVRRLPELYTK